jgi:hypothetical protein
LYCQEQIDDEDDDSDGVHAQSSIACLGAESFVDLCTELAGKHYSPQSSSSPLGERLQVHRSEQAARLIRRADLVQTSRLLPTNKRLSSSSSVPNATKTDQLKQKWSTSQHRGSLRELCDGEVNCRDDEINAGNLKVRNNNSHPCHHARR